MLQISSTVLLAFIRLSKFPCNLRQMLGMMRDRILIWSNLLVISFLMLCGSILKSLATQRLDFSIEFSVFMYMSTLFVYCNSFFFFICNPPFTSFSCLIALVNTFSTMMNRSGDEEYLSLVFNLRKSFQHFRIKYDVFSRVFGNYLL